MIDSIDRITISYHNINKNKSINEDILVSNYNKKFNDILDSNVNNNCTKLDQRLEKMAKIE